MEHTTLKNVSFRLTKTICIEKNVMNKLTYAALKGLSVIDLSKVTVI